jgi:hypothetical protein
MVERGRRPKGEYPEKKLVFVSRIRGDTQKMLQRAAARSGRSVSQEFEHKLRRACDEDERIEDSFGDPRTFALMKIAAMAAVNSSPPDQKASKSHWTANVEAFDRAVDAIVNVLKAFRPHELVASDLVTQPPELGAPALELAREIQSADPARPLDKISKRQRAMLRLKDELGDLVDRPSRTLQVKNRKIEKKKS